MHTLRIIHYGLDNQWYCTCGGWHMLIRQGFLDTDAVDSFIEHLNQYAEL